MMMITITMQPMTMTMTQMSITIRRAALIHLVAFCSNVSNAAANIRIVAKTRLVVMVPSFPREVFSG